MTVAEFPATHTEIEAECGRRSLRYFLEHAWLLVDPAHPFIPNWHIDAIVEHLEAVSWGEIRDLVINIPPGMAKSLTVSVCWQPWEWTWNPASRWLFSSYAAELSTRDAVRSRRIMQSDWYHARWGDSFSLTSDQNVKTRYENDATGFRIATSVGGLGTGERGDKLIADDPHNVKTGESDAVRKGTLLWWSEVMPTRRNDPQNSARVVIMQRVHEEDVTAWSLDHGFEHLCLPQEYEGKNRCRTSLGFKDPRKREGELLFPELYPQAIVERLKNELRPYGVASQFQQNPVPRGGGLIKREWFEEKVIGHDRVPKTRNRVRFWDKAGTEAGGKFTAGVLMSEHKGKFYVEDVVRGQWSAASREATIKETAERDADIHGVHGFRIWLEQEPGSGGKESAENSVRMLAGFSARAEPVTGDKFARADPFAAAAERGDVHVVRGPWNEAWFQELESASKGSKYLDQMDATAGAFNKLARRSGTRHTAAEGLAEGWGSVDQGMKQVNEFDFRVD